jgi:membrane fusion protein (multidrug efflux system)
MLHLSHHPQPPAHRVAIHALVLSAALMLAACGQSTTTPPAAKATEVGVVTLKAQALDVTRELSGRTVAAETAEIRPQISGIVQSRLFDEGSVVKAGQALYQIDPASYQAAQDSADAAVAKAEATLQSARLTAVRQASLLAADAGSSQDNETAQAALLQAQAELKSAQASAASARLDLQRTRITAPIDGRVGISTVTAGALVTANQTTALTTVQQTDPMWVNVSQSSGELLKMRQQISNGSLHSGALAVRLQLEDGSTYEHAGELAVSGVSVDTSTGAVTLRAKVPNPDGLLMPGMYVQVQVAQAHAPEAVLAPQTGVQRDTSGGASALVVGADGKVEKRAVEVAEVHGTLWRVTRGLAAGDRLIVQGNGKVRPGQIVSAVEVGAAAAEQPASAAATATPSPTTTPSVATRVAHKN